MSADRILGKYYPVLDHGFVSLQGVFGGDADIEQFARVSYQKGTRTLTDTRGLIRYLVAHKHTSPLEAVEFKFHLKMPLFVARQWMRHRTANVNEVSARYSVLPEQYYVPEPARIGAQSTTNKQGSEEGLDLGVQEDAAESIRLNAEAAFDDYRDLLDDGVARETARMVLPLNTYTEMYWKMDLKNLLHFLSLRCDAHAQYEIRAYANVIARTVEMACPLAYEAWLDYDYNAVTFSRIEMEQMRTDWDMHHWTQSEGIWVDGATVQTSAFTDREWKGFIAKWMNPRAAIPELNSNLFYVRLP
jgi:thymidylate synthase (FAD)